MSVKFPSLLLFVFLYAGCSFQMEVQSKSEARAAFEAIAQYSQRIQTIEQITSLTRQKLSELQTKHNNFVKATLSSGETEQIEKSDE